MIVGTLILFSFELTERYKIILLPFLTSSDTLLGSVSEHEFPSLESLWEFNSFFLLLAPIGVQALILNKKIELSNKIIILITAFTFIYFGISVMRLQLILSIGLILLSSIGIWSMYEYLKNNTRKKKQKTLVGILTIVLVLMVVPTTYNWIDLNDRPPIILTGLAFTPIITTDWLDSMEYLKSLPSNTTVFAWWDYGYVINVLGEKTTFMDNATLDSPKMIKYAKIFASEPEIAHGLLKEIGADYVLINSMMIKQEKDYDIFAGGDESKAYWIFKIADVPFYNFNEEFWNNSLTL